MWVRWPQQLLHPPNLTVIRGNITVDPKSRVVLLPPAPPCLSFPTGEFGISSHHNRANIGHTANGGGHLGAGEPLPPLGEEAGKLHPGADGAKIGIRIKETTKGLKK